MVRVLFMPLLQFPSGHHHVADTITEQLTQLNGNFHCEKIEMISHCYGKFEALISFIYLQSIHKFPKVYSQIYKTAAVRGISRKRYYTYEILFLRKVQQMLKTINPNIIICTHALPSYLVNYFKKSGLWSGLVINVYTDFFINDLWGMEHIDYHFVPSQQIKQNLISKGVDHQQIFVTGIPVHPIFKEEKEKKKLEEQLTILISGGNMGAGSIQQLLYQLNPSGKIQYKVLCGRNDELYQSIKRLSKPQIQALPYISSKTEMNQLYEEASAIITKPGGVTISECLWKRLPIFVYEALPGQEEYNLQYLRSQRLILPLDVRNAELENFIIHSLKEKGEALKKSLDTYYDNLEHRNESKIIEEILTY